MPQSVYSIIMNDNAKERLSRPSNHEITKRKVQSQIADYDIPKAIRQFGLLSDAQYLYVDFMTRRYRIDRYSGATVWSEDGFPANKEASFCEAGFNEVLSIFDILFYSREDASLCGEYTVMQNLSRVQTTSSYAGKGMFLPSEEFWDKQPEELAKACERLGGVPAGKGDVAYRIPIFQDIDMILQFWQSDEDFPASMQFLFDQNLLQFMHYETVWYVVSHCLDLLKQ